MWRRFRSYFGQLGKLLVLMSHPKHPLLGFRVCEPFCHCACGSCAVAPVFWIARKRFHVPLGQYAGDIIGTGHIVSLTASSLRRNQSPSAAQQSLATGSNLPKFVTQGSASSTPPPLPQIKFSTRHCAFHSASHVNKWASSGLFESCRKSGTYRSLRYLQLAALVPSAGTITF